MTSPAIPLSGRGVTATSGYWPAVATVAALLVAVLAARVHEHIPALYPLKPALLLGVGGCYLAVSRSSSEVVRSATHDPIYRFIFLYFAWAAATAPFALWVGQAVDTLMAAFPVVFMLTVIMVAPPTWSAVDRMVSGLVGGAALVCAKTIALGTPGTGDRFAAGGSLDANDTAALMALCFPLALGLVRRRTGLARVLALVAAILFVTMVVKTSSRGGTLALIVATLVYVLGFRPQRAVLLLALAVAAGGVTWTVAPQTFRDRILTINSVEEDYNYTAFSGRKQIWKRARGYIRDNPVMGVGIGNFPTAEGEYCKALGIRCKWSVTHNAYLQAGAELGLVGGALFIGVLGVSVKRGWRMWRPRRGTADPSDASSHRPEYLAAMLAFCAAAYFLSHAYSYAMFAIAGLTAVAIRAAHASAAGPGHPAPPLPAARTSGWRTARSAALTLAPDRAVRRLPAHLG